MDEVRFDGKVAVVTGAGRGIGREEALLLAARGARVVVNDWGRSGDGHATTEQPGKEVVELIHASGGEAVLDTSLCGSAATDRRLRRGKIGRVGDRALVPSSRTNPCRVRARCSRSVRVVARASARHDVDLPARMAGHGCAALWPYRQHVVGDDARREELVGLSRGQRGSARVHPLAHRHRAITQHHRQRDHAFLCGSAERAHSPSKTSRRIGTRSSISSTRNSCVIRATRVRCIEDARSGKGPTPATSSQSIPSNGRIVGGTTCSPRASNAARSTLTASNSGQAQRSQGPVPSRRTSPSASTQARR
jgi:NAD(P)-dependent dehydrogenase (short-subunit alcohol dehydrogenase family)